MSKIREILEGHINELKSSLNIADQEVEKIFEKRAEICLACPMKSGNTCNSSLYIDKITKETYTQPGENRVRGCGCRLSAKNRSLSSRCPADFW